MALVGAATLVAAMLQSATGFGFALLLGPILFAFYEPAHALGTVLVLGAALNLLMLYGERRSREIRRDEVVVLVLSAIPGLVGGVLILEALSKPTLEIVVGVAIVVAALGQVRRPISSRHEAPPAAPASRALAAGFGILAGVLTTTTGANGPPQMIWFHRVGASPAQLRDSNAAVFLALNALGALTLSLLGREHLRLELPTITLLLGLTVAGHRIGRLAFERFDAATFRRASIALILAAGVTSVLIGATS